MLDYDHRSGSLLLFNEFLNASFRFDFVLLRNECNQTLISNSSHEIEKFYHSIRTQDYLAYHKLGVFY